MAKEKARIKASLTTTVFNEAESIEKLLKSILAQTVLPDEVIIVDGGSTDSTIETINKFVKTEPYFRQHLLFESKPLNRPQGRNLGIKLAKHDILVSTDAGCVLRPDWFEKITAPLVRTSVQIVSGYYTHRSSSVFQKCVAAYVLVMPDKINPKEFLPSTRSLAMRREVWEKAGGFPEEYPLNEDYVFDLTVKKLGYTFHFVQDAIVEWIPRESLLKTVQMFYFFAKGDAQAKIVRPKVVLLFGRYFIGFMLLILLYFTGSPAIFYSIVLGVLFYSLWSIVKNYRYINDFRAIFILPVLQFSADVSVIWGSVAGFYSLWDTQKKS